VQDGQAWVQAMHGTLERLAALAERERKRPAGST